MYGNYEQEYHRIKYQLFSLVHTELEMLDVFTCWEDFQKDDGGEHLVSLERYRCRRMSDALEQLGLKESFMLWRESKRPVYQIAKFA